MKFFHWPLIQRITLILFTIPIVVSETFNECPQTHPYAFFGYNRCCTKIIEKEYDERLSQDQCNGGDLEIYSLCCKGEFIECPRKPCYINMITGTKLGF